MADRHLEPDSPELRARCKAPNASAITPKFVTLNLFQGPSGRKLGAIRRGTQLAARLATVRSGDGEKWVLKQVQDDGKRYGFA